MYTCEKCNLFQDFMCEGNAGKWGASPPLPSCLSLSVPIPNLVKEFRESLSFHSGLDRAQLADAF